VPETGSQVVAKVGMLLRSLAAPNTPGHTAARTTTDIARLTGLSRPTAHRLLSSLIAEGLVDRDPDTGGWLLGPELYLLGAAAAARYDVTERARDILELVAIETGESVYLSSLRGQQTVCLLEEEGSFPLRSHVLHVGIRFPLGVASAGLAILAHLDPAETDRYLAGAELTRDWGPAHSADAIRARVTATRETGYAVNPGLIVEGSWGTGAAVFDRGGRPRWALSITGIEARMRAPRQHQLGHLLLQQAHRLGQRIARG
jgi:DNA-binding IclR family transcriptional regulator